MAHSFTFPEAAQIVGALKPAADAAGRSGRWVSLKHAHKAYVVAHIDQGNAATIKFDIDQAKDVAGTGAKAITGAVRIWFVQDLATSDAAVRQADATSFTTDAGVKEKQVIIELDPATLDMAGGFRCIRVKTGASNIANITQAVYVLAPGRYKSAPQPSAIVD